MPTLNLGGKPKYQEMKDAGMSLFWVVGGQYTDTHFQDTVGSKERWFGPFRDYQAAKEEWAKHAWQRVDRSTTHYRIECIDPDAPPPCTD